MITKKHEKDGTSKLVLIKCPFCGVHQTLYVWELIGQGASCKCGARHQDNNTTIKDEE